MSDKNVLNKKPQSFLQGSFILLLSTALVKVIGALFRIPLGNLMDDAGVGMGYYSVAYDLYLPIYSLAMAGLPIAISRMVAENVAKQRYKDVLQTLKVTRKAFWVTGTVSFLLMCAIAYPFAYFTKSVDALPAIFCIVPSLIFCCIMSTYRGYYEGFRNMYPTAFSSVIEALGKLILGYGMAWLVITYTGSLVYGAAAALLGITLGTAFGALYLVIKYRRHPYDWTKEQWEASVEPKSSRETFKMLIAIAIPVVLGSMVTYVTGFIDVIMVKRQLANVIENNYAYFQSAYPDLLANCVKRIVEESKGALTEAAALADTAKIQESLSTALYGCYKGYAYSIYNLIPVLTSVLGVSALPVLATSWTKKDKAGTKKNIELMLRTTVLIAFPAGLGIATLSKPILSLLYPDHSAVVDVAAPLLSVLGIAAAFAGVSIPITNMLQAIGRQKVPVRNMAIGAVLKIVVNIVLVGNYKINMLGAPIGTLCCYVFIAVANFACLVKYSNVMPNIVSTILKPFIATVLCCAAAFGVSKFIDGKLGTLAAIAVAAVVYLIALALLKAIEREDVLSMPKGEKLAAILTKLKVLR